MRCDSGGASVPGVEVSGKLQPKNHRPALHLEQTLHFCCSLVHPQNNTNDNNDNNAAASNNNDDDEQQVDWVSAGQMRFLRPGPGLHTDLFLFAPLHTVALLLKH